MPSYTSLMKHRELMERKELYEAWEQSGLTKIEFCRQNNIAKRSFFKWIKQLRNNNYIDDNDASILNAVNDITTTGDVAAVDNGRLETDSLKFLKISEISQSSFVSSQKRFSLESSSSGSLEISLPNGTVIKITVSQNNINKFLQEIIKNGNRSTF